jgi:tetratricopeptide (TPR) repeat protein
MVDFSVALADAIKWVESLSTGEQWLLGLVISVLFPVLLSMLSRPFRALLFGLARSAASLFQTKPRYPPQRPTRRVIGRDGILSDIHDALTGGKIGVIAPPATVTGGPGMGKTTVAREYLSRHGGEFQRTKILDAERSENLLAQIGDLIEGIEGKLHDRAMTALRRIADDTGRKWLLIYDNAPSPEAVEHLIPYAGHVKALITTRAHDWPAAKFRVFPADYLTPADALTLLLETANRVGDADPEAALLAKDLGWTPIGLVQAGETLLVNPAASFGEYRARLLEFTAEWMKPGALEDRYPMTVAAAISLSLDLAVADKDTGLDVAALLALLPWLAPEGMDAKLVLDIPSCALPNPKKMWDDIPQRYFDLATDPARLQAAIGALARRSLAVAEGTGPSHTVALHRITAQILRAQDGAQADARRRAAAAVVAASYPGGDRSPEHIANWPDCRRLNPHVAALFAPANAGGAAAPDPPASAATEFLLNQASVFHQEHAATEVALAYARAALDLKIARLGPDHPEVGTGHANLGGALCGAEAWAEAVTEYRKALRIAEAQGADYPLLGTRLSNLASAMKGEATTTLSGDALRVQLHEVAKLQRRAYKVDRRLHGARHEGTATRLNNLALTFAMLGDLRRALRIGALALATRRKELAPGDPRLAFSLSNLGGYRMNDRAPDRALPLLTEALDIRAAALAVDHPHRVTTARWLTLCHLAQQAPDVAGAAALCKTYGFDFDEINRDAAQYRPLS